MTDSFRSIKRSLWVREDVSSGLNFSSEEGSPFDVPSLEAVKRDESPFIESEDVRNYYEPQFTVNELFIGHEKSLTSPTSQMVKVDDREIIIKRGADVAMRCFRQGKIGIAPPPCLL
jgi:hypothetical protein